MILTKYQKQDNTQVIMKYYEYQSFLKLLIYINQNTSKCQDTRV